MPPVKPIGTRSSLFSHSFPSFYACYLLKSVQTPCTTSIYIGSTPSPPRRIRQHNGELAQGARKTRLKRPWVMQMIVHGFPSRLAALQFEWAWQHPHKSRHMRDGTTSIFGSRAHKTLQKNILIVRTMMSRPPFNIWPLHVKLFTHEAHQYWKDSMTNDIASPLPPGFTYTLELEGVDGKSGHAGSGRQEPINIQDDKFTSAILAKSMAVAAAGGNVECTICREPILNYAVSPLSTALCPSSKCHAVSHLICLSQNFINQEGRPAAMVPRGGHCKSCKQYTLWGDIIRGCYRRMPPLETAILDIDSDNMFVSDNQEVQGKAKLSRKKSESPMKRHKSSKEKGKERQYSSSTSISNENEVLDLSNIVSSSESEGISGQVKRKPGRPRKLLDVISHPTTLQLSSKGCGNQKQFANSLSATSAERGVFDFTNLIASLEIEDNGTLMKRAPGRPRRDLPILSPGASSLILSPFSLKASGKTKTSESRAKPKLSSKGKTRQSSGSLSTNEGETFDNLIASSEIEPTSIPVDKKRGRPGKDVPLPLSRITVPIVSTQPRILLDISTKEPQTSTPTDCRGLSKEKGKQKRALGPMSLISSSEGGSPVASPDRGDTSTSVKRQRGRPRKTLAVISSPMGPGQSSKGKVDFPKSVDISNSLKIKPGRPPNNMALFLSSPGSPISSPQPHKTLESKDVPALTRAYYTRGKGLKAASDDSSSGESFDFDGILDSDSSDGDVMGYRNTGSNHRDVRTTQIAWPLHRKVDPLKLGVGTRDLRGMRGPERAVSFTPRRETSDESNGPEVIVVSD